MSYTDNNLNGPAPLRPALQFGQQSNPIPAQTYDWEVMQRANAEYQNSYSLIHERADVEIKKYEARLKLDQETTIHMWKVREDILLQREMLEDTVSITESGEFIRKQEFLLEKPKTYSWANFRLISRPIKYVCYDSNGAVLFINVIGEDQEERNVFLDLGRDSAGYLLKKFRKSGLNFKKKRGEQREVIFEIVQAIIDRAETVELPLKRGFYTTQDKRLHYAGKEDLIWAEVETYAE